MYSSPLRVRPSISSIFVAALGLHPFAVSAAESLETVQKAAADWAKVRAETVQLETEWRVQRASLEATLAALQAKIAELEKSRDVLQAEVDHESARTGDIVTKNADYRTALTTIEERLSRLTAQLTALRPWLPPRLASGLDLAFRSIEDPKLGPAERMQHVITIFNRCGSFNQAMTFVEEPLALDGSGQQRLLEVMYAGLSHAYALDRANNIAYLGRPGPGGWKWEKRDNLAAGVARLIAIHEETSDPEFVALPVQVSDPAFAASATAAQP